MSLGGVWSLCAGVAGGIAAGQGSGGLGLRIAALAVATLGVARMRRSPATSTVVVLLVGVAAGATAGALTTDPSPLASVAKSVARCHVEGRLIERVADVSLVGVETAACDEATYIDAGVVAVRDVDRPPGARLTLEGWFVALGTRGYEGMLRNLGAHASFHVQSAEVIAAPRGPFAVAHRIRTGLDIATRRIESRAAGLLAGLTIGDTSDMDRATQDGFRAAGLSHLVAVSGSNVAIVIGTVLMVTRRMSLLARIALAAASVALYVLVVGPDASVLRAATMAAVMLLALLAGARTHPLHSLGLATAMLLIVRPGLLWSVGLHMSVAATAGILLWTQAIAARIPGPRWVAMVGAVTLSAQAAVAPIVVLVFGTVSVVSPLANLVTAPLIAPATVLGLFAAVTGTWAPALARLAARAAAMCAQALLLVADTASAPAWAAIELPPAAGWGMGLAVGIGALVTLRRMYR